MKIIVKSRNYVCKWTRGKEDNLTWRQVKAFCLREVARLKSSKEAIEIEAIKKTIALLQRKVDCFNARISKYEGMAATISDTDPSIDVPFGDSE